jgi:mono/diheme cytochrome c family protein
MKFRNHLLIVSCLVSGFASFALAQTPGPLTADPVYDKNCAKCHGKTAEGRHFGGPALATTTQSEDQLKTIISNGKGRMPKYAGKLTDEQIATLASEIAAMKSAAPQK